MVYLAIPFGWRVRVQIPVGVQFLQKRKILKMIKIFIDDIRIPVEKDWIIVSTVEEAKNIIQNSDNFILSLDHDLGEKEGTNSYCFSSILESMIIL